MQIVPPLTLPSLGFSQFRKLVQPLLISHGCPASGATGPIQRWPGRGRIDLFPTGVQTVFFRRGTGVSLTLVSGTVALGLWDITADHGAIENSQRVLAQGESYHSSKRLCCNS